MEVGWPEVGETSSVLNSWVLGYIRISLNIILNIHSTFSQFGTTGPSQLTTLRVSVHSAPMGLEHTWTPGSRAAAPAPKEVVSGSRMFRVDKWDWKSMPMKPDPPGTTPGRETRQSVMAVPE